MEKKDSVYSPLGSAKKRFLKWQMRTIAVTMIGYALFYFVRKNFSLAMPGLTAEYGISNKSFGWILFAGSLVCCSVHWQTSHLALAQISALG